MFAQGYLSVGARLMDTRVTKRTGRGDLSQSPMLGGVHRREQQHSEPLLGEQHWGKESRAGNLGDKIIGEERRKGKERRRTAREGARLGGFQEEQSIFHRKKKSF